MSINRYKTNLKNKINNSLQEYANRVLEEANQLTPVDTGFLKSKNEVIVTDSNITFRNTAPYSKFVYYGTSKQTGKRWFERAILRNS